MSPLIKKEIRLLLPAWIAAMLLAIAPAWIMGTGWNLNFDYGWFMDFSLRAGIPILFSLGILLLGLSSFGQEFSQGTFAVLLAQPMERSRIWQVKITILALALFSAWIAVVVSTGCQLYLHDYFPYHQPIHSAGSDEFNYAIGFLTLSVLVVFSGGLWTTLLFRQVSAAFWFTLLTPLAIILGICSVFSDRLDSGKSINSFIVVALAVYSIAGFFAAAILFRRCQDIQGGGSEVSLPNFKKFSVFGKAAHACAIPFRPRHWFSALARKEFQLHQANILIAALILLLHLFSFIVRKIHPHFNNPNIPSVLEAFWLLWLLMPFLLGCSAIAEERRLGIMESQLSLPVSRRMQLVIKFSIGLFLSLLFGAAIPLLVEGTKDLSYWLFLTTAASFFISFYASSLARTVLQAIGLAIVVGVALLFAETISVINPLINLLPHRYFGDTEHGLDLLKTFLGLPILLVVLIRLIFWNYKQLRQNTSLLLINFSSLMAAFAVIYLLIFGIYFRAWEYVTPTLPLRGLMRLSPATEVKLAGSPGAIYAVLPDGRLWTQKHNYLFLATRLGYWDASTFGVSTKGQVVFVPGTNWVEAAVDDFQALGIRSDGSLWSLQRQWSMSGNRLWQSGPFFTLTQIGSDTNWSQAVGNSIGFLLLKNDGSLWTWGTNGFDHWPNKLKFDLSQLPARLGDETNWIRLCSSELSPCAINNNGDVWSWLAWIGTNNVSRFTRAYAAYGQWSTITINQHGHPVRIATAFAGKYTANAPWSSFTPDWNNPYVRITTNGELWVTPCFKTTAEDSEWAGGRFFPLSREKWASATFDSDRLIAIRSDGTLWKWPPIGIVPSESLPNLRPVQLGSHSDWIALSPGGLALASDGSLWAWDQPSHYAWLGPSSKPTYMGNIFEGTPASP